MAKSSKLWLVASVSWVMVAFILASVLVYASSRKKFEEKNCNEDAPTGYEPDRKAVVESLTSVSEHSSDLSNWGILLLAGSIAMIVGTSYLRPARLEVRLAYLLLPPAWTLLALSVLAGREVKGNYLAATTTAERYLYGTSACADASLGRQLDFLFAAVLVLGLWLLVFLHWWVFGPQEETKK